MKKVLIFLGLVAIVAIAGTVGNCTSGICASPNTTVRNNSRVPHHFMAAVAENPKTVQLKITGMDCAMCTNAIHKKLSQTNGIIKDGISYENGSAVITYDPAKITVEKIIKIIKDEGYKATIVKESNAQKA